MKRIAFATLGCRVNWSDSERMERAASMAGYRTVPFGQAADVVVLNSCTVTHLADREARKLARAARRNNPDARVVVTGCYAEVSPEALRSLEEVDLVLGNLDKDHLLERLGELEAGRPEALRPSPPVASARSLELPLFDGSPDRQRPVLKIQDGCNHRCSFCVVPRARGASRSVPPEQVLAQLEHLGARGIPEVVLSGVHVAGYGRDLTPPIPLEDLLRRAAALPEAPRMRLSSIEPVDMSPGVVDLLASGSGAFCRYLHMAVQSGSDRTLERMGRRYRRDDFLERSREILAQIPGIGIGLDLMVGFPGESEADFEETVSLVEELPAAFLHVFPYSTRTRTRAAEMPDPVAPDVKRRRAARLRELGSEKRRDFLASQQGAELPAVAVAELAGPGEETWLRCLTDNYLEVHVPRGGARLGDGVRVRLEDPDPVRATGSLLGVETSPTPVALAV